MDIVYAVVSAVIALGILIVFHELGHFLVAKRTGVGVVTFSVGFGPRVFGRKLGETDYVLSAFPLGGYVKMVGEDPEQEVQEVDLQKSFSHQRLAKRTAIVAAGPVFNFLLSVFIFTAIFVFFGVPIHMAKVGGVAPDSPAARAGIMEGDKIVSVDGQPINKWEELSRLVRASQGRPVVLRLERDNREIEITVEPKEGEGRNVFGEKEKIWVIGVASAGAVSIEKRTPWVAVWQALYRTGEYSVLTLVALYKMVTGAISPKNLGGPLLIAQVAGQQAQQGVWNFLFFVAILSVNLGVLNLLPIPVLDGGHLLFFLLEWILGRPVELKQRERAQQIGIFILILVMIYAFYNDIARFFEG